MYLIVRYAEIILCQNNLSTLCLSETFFYQCICVTLHPNIIYGHIVFVFSLSSLLLLSMRSKLKAERRDAWEQYSERNETVTFRKQQGSSNSEGTCWEQISPSYPACQLMWLWKSLPILLIRGESSFVRIHIFNLFYSLCQPRRYWSFTWISDEYQ